ncbi:MAG: hypothetical protein A3G73_00205 [Rhodospirillales bacterium RIFCSPLOWO2_12_FULL_67_15]|nr:MAG: hypothetical protein A3G73_00205 [Rhodospirillales bacterium RIFCSPLOWO2_12_FULL_67_15]
MTKAYPDVVPVAVAETVGFRRSVGRLLSEDEISALVDFLAYSPEAGVLIRGTGGLRKLRVGAQGRGKRGGARVIYYYHSEAMPLYLLLAYSKSERDDLTPDQRKALMAVVENELQGKRR